MTEPAPPVDTISLLRGRADDPPNIRLLRWAVIGMGVLLVAGFLAVVLRIVYLVNRPAATTVSQTFGGAGPATIVKSPLVSSVVVNLPPGARIKSQSLSAQRLAVHYEAANGETILVIDLETGLPVSEVKLSSPAR